MPRGQSVTGDWRPALAFYASIALNFLLLIMSSLSRNMPFLATVVHVLGWPAVFLTRCVGRLGPELPLVPFLMFFSLTFYFALFWAVLYVIARDRARAPAQIN